ncbi:serine hydrolase [Caulobacter sp. BP25]|uniref:serine hydrolase n=1 Tax=Caulobacter sp. BP25 TaxID=2048900 RepID=UPI000C12C835|nr:serine hydrolase [Caulobacter sp. BP25]PHY17324.1 serine hydrolase [Caulobacter sp. BP25]
MLTTTRRSALVSALATTGLAAFGSRAFAQETGAVAAAVDQFAQQVMAAFPDQPGLGITVVERGKTTLAKGYGVKTLGTQDRCDENTIFGIASNTKAMTAALLGMLIEEGRLAWDDPVTKHLPDFVMSDPTVTKLMTVRDLLVHRSGLTLGAGDLMLWPAPTHTRAEIVAGLKYLPIGGQFRGGYAYDNVLYVVAGAVIEAVTGQTWEAVIKSRIFDPLGMTSTVASPALVDRSRRASPHARLGPPTRGLGPQTALPFDASFDAAAPAGGTNSTPKDIARWMQVQLGLGMLPNGKRLWSEPTAREMWRPHTITSWSEGPTDDNPARPSMQAYGLGWFVQDHRGERIVWHTGGLAGFISYTALLPGRKSGIMIMTNAEETPVLRSLRYGGADRLQGRADYDWIASSKRLQAESDAQALKDLARATAPSSGAKPSLPLEAYAGVYRDPWYGTVTITLVGKGKAKALRVSFDKTPALRGKLEPFDGETFKTTFDDRTQEDAFFTFDLKDGHAVSALVKAVSPLADFSYDYQDLRLSRVS